MAGKVLNINIFSPIKLQYGLIGKSPAVCHESYNWTLCKNNDHFFFSKDEFLDEKCNAPKNSSGIYLIYALAHGQIELIYVGSSGKMQPNGKLKTRSGGIFDRIVNGKQFDEPRKKSWPKKMDIEQIEALDIYWYVTFNNEVKDIPAYAEGLIIQRHFDIYGKLPRWNSKF